MIVHEVDKDLREVQPGVRRCVLGHGERLMAAEMSLEQGALVQPHQHPHEQITYVVCGMVQMSLGGRAVVLHASESCLVRGGVLHGAEALADCVLLDVFSPPREDFLPSD